MSPFSTDLAFIQILTQMTICTNVKNSMYELPVSFMGEPEQYSPLYDSLYDHLARGSTMGKTRETFTRYVKICTIVTSSLLADNLVLKLIISDFLATQLLYTKISRQRRTLNGFASATD